MAIQFQPRLNWPQLTMLVKEAPGTAHSKLLFNSSSLSNTPPLPDFLWSPAAVFIWTIEYDQYSIILPILAICVGNPSVTGVYYKLLFSSSSLSNTHPYQTSCGPQQQYSYEQYVITLWRIDMNHRVWSIQYHTTNTGHLWGESANHCRV